MNITQYGEIDIGEIDQTDVESRRDSIRDILNLGFTAHMETSNAPELPRDRAGVIRFQHENMAAAVNSATQSTVHSSVHSAVHSKVHSRAVSTAASLMGSRYSQF